MATAPHRDTLDLAATAAHTSLKRARLLFDHGDAAAALIPSVDPDIQRMAKERRRRNMLPGTSSVAAAAGIQKSSQALVVSDGRSGVKKSSNKKIAVETVDAAAEDAEDGILTLRPEDDDDDEEKAKPQGILVKSSAHSSLSKNVNIPKPTWHSPWKLSTVLSSHLGWVRSLAFSPDNQYLASGSADRTIKIWNFAKASVGAPDALQLTLTGHISPIRGLAFSEKHPYLFSAAEDKAVKCWDLETNQVIRHYHGHLSGVFCLALHPTLDILVTGGRDAVARVWDMRSKKCIHVLAGHEHTVASLLTKGTHPQIITGSHDCTVKLWDLAAGKCFSTLTHHQKSIRALVQPSFEHTFTSGAADCLKQWQGKDGRFLKSFTGHKAVVNALAVNDDGVLVSGGDDGSMRFWDYKSGYTFQTAQAQVQPGSLEAENAIYALHFDGTGSRLVTAEADKTIKIWKPDDAASELSHPIDMAGWRKKCIAQAKQRV